MAGVGGITALVVALIVGASALGVGSIIWANLDETLVGEKPGMSAQANETIDKVIENTWDAFDLSSLLPFIMGAGSVIAGLIGFLSFSRSD